MRHGTTSRRQRNRSNGGRRNNQQRTQVYDSNGPDVRIRGTAHQVAEKYLALAKDSLSGGDRVLAESYYQHAEHYIRIINDMNGKFEPSKPVGENSSESDPHNSSPNIKNMQSDDEDLSLPASIIGGEKSARQQEVEAAD